MTTLPTHSGRAHSRLGASKAHIWMVCPGSVRMCADLPDRSTFYGRQGTAAHQLAEWCLRNERDPDEYSDESITVAGDDFPVDEEMVDAVRVFVDAVREHIDPDDVVFYEKRFDLSRLHPDLYGTADVVIYKPKTKQLIVPDYKHGSGVVVEVLDNKQARYYAVGAALDLGEPVEKVTLLIAQPRAAHRDGPVRAWTIDAVDLLDFAGELVAAAEATENPNAPLVPGDHCRFCPAAATCPALSASVIEKVGFEPVDEPPAPSSITPEQRAAIIRYAGTIKGWLKAVEAYAHEQDAAGNKTPGFKRVEGRSVRRWRDEAEAEAFLTVYGFDEADLYKRKLLGPAPIEKKLGAANKGAIAGLIVKPPGKPILVPDDDPRPALVGAIEMFSPIGDGEA